MTVQATVLSLSAAYALLGAILLAILSMSRHARSLKIVAVVAVSGCYLAVFFSFQGLLGWSAPVRVPARFQLLWARVVEPNAAHADAGAVHLWLEELDSANLPSGRPRAYLLPYSQALARKIAASQSEIRQGHAQGGMTHSFGTGLGEAPIAVRAGADGVPPGGDPSGGGLLDPEFLGGQSKSVDLVPLPAPLLPPKDNP